MILIADSGSTKTQWRLVSNDKKYADFTTCGLNPYFASKEVFVQEIADSFPVDFSTQQVEQVFFYGAGCGTDEKVKEVQSHLKSIFFNASIEVYTDILAAGRALFGKSSGFVVIVGTGSNVGYYNGSTLEQKTPSLGFAIGDEGSGAHMGKLLAKKWLYGQLPAELNEKIKNFCNLTISQILLKIYSEKSPSQFLAGFVPFINENIENAEIQSIVRVAFEELIRNHLLCYDTFPNEPVGIVGSVGCIFKDYFEEEIKKFGGVVSKNIQYPINELAVFHTNR